MSQTQTQTVATSAEAPKAEAPKVTLLAITPAQAQDVAADLASAAKRREGADGTFLENVCAAVEGLPPMTAAQFQKQLAPSIREALKRKLKGKADTTLASYASRFKTLTLALVCGDASLQPIAGEAYTAYLARAAEGIAKGKLPDGTPIWPADVARSGKAAGTGKAKGAGAPVGGPTGGHVDVSAAKSGGQGLDVRPALAAAMILCHGNAARAQRLVVACESYPVELDKWLAAILSDDDKGKLSKLASVQTAEGDKREAATPPAGHPETAMAAAMIEAAKPGNKSRRGKVAA